MPGCVETDFLIPPSRPPYLIVFHSIRKSRRLPNTFVYLITYFTFSNAFAAVGSLAILFAVKSLRMTTSQLTVALGLAPFSALAGGYFWLWMSRRNNWSTKKMLLILLSLTLLLPIYGLLGYIPNTYEVTVIAGTGPNKEGALTLGFGLKSVLEMYIATCYLSSLLGAVQSFGRVLYTDLLPREHESEFFTLFEVCLRGTSWIGPLIVGAIANSVGGDLRPGFVYIVVTIIIPIVLLWKRVDVPKGRRECERFVVEEDFKRKHREERRALKKLQKQEKKERKRLAKRMAKHQAKQEAANRSVVMVEVPAASETTSTTTTTTTTAMTLSGEKLQRV